MVDPTLEKVRADRKLRQLLEDISRSNKGLTTLEVMWQVRSYPCNQAEIPQAIFRVGDRLASVIYLEDSRCWEVQLDGDEHQFCSVWGFEDALAFIEQCRQEQIGLV